MKLWKHNNDNFIQQHGKVIGKTYANFASMHWMGLDFVFMSHSESFSATFGDTLGPGKKTPKTDILYPAPKNWQLDGEQAFKILIVKTTK